MTVYADILVIVNLYIDFFLLWCVKKALRLRAGNGRLVLGALTGALCALTALLPQPPPLLSLLLGIAGAVVTTLSAFAPLPLRMLLKTALCFWAFSLALAGFFLFLIRFFVPGRMAVLGNAFYLDLSPLLLFLFTCGAYLVFRVLGKLFPGEASGARYCSLVLENRGHSVNLLAKADTGSALREPFSGLPVIVCQTECLKETAPPAVAEFLKSGNGPGTAVQAEGLRLIPFESLGGGGLLPAFRPQKVLAGREKIPLECWVAACGRNLSAGQFAALYNPDQFPALPKDPQFFHGGT